MSKKDFIFVPKDKDKIIIKMVKSLFSEKLPQEKLDWLIRICRHNYYNNGVIKAKIDNRISMTLSEVYKVVSAYIRHEHTNYNSQINFEQKSHYVNYGMMRNVFNNDDELITEMLEGLNEKKIPKFDGKYFPNPTKH
jgi:hypothetical protein